MPQEQKFSPCDDDDDDDDDSNKLRARSLIDQLLCNRGWCQNSSRAHKDALDLDSRH